MKPIARTGSTRPADALRKSEERYRLLIENSPDIFYTLTPKGVFVFVSSAWTALLGHPAAQVAGKPFQDFVHPDDLARYQAFLQSAKEPGMRQAGIEHRFLHADGSCRWYNTRLVPQRDKAGRVVGYEGIASDITERRPAEEALRESEERSRLIYENARDTLWLMDMSFKTTWISPSVVRTRGFKPEELHASTLDQHMTPASLAIMTEAAAKQLSPDNLADKNREVVVEGVYEFFRKDRTTFWGDTIATLIRDRAGAPMGFLCVVRDITERRRAEAALQASEARYRQLVENANEAILVAQDGLLKFVNRMAVEMTGYPEKELLLRPFPELVHPDDREIVVGHYQKRIAGETAQPRYVFRVLARDGGIKWVEIWAVLIDWEGRPATLNFLTDISERHKADEAIQASLREKEVMLREIHHRVKNNMQVISSLFNLQAGHTLDRECREILKKGQTRIQAMSLVHEKLYRSRDLSRIDLAAYAKSLATQLFEALAADPHQVRLEMDFGELSLDINSSVPCGLILNELISNSLKHAFPEGRKGSIRIGLKRGPKDTIVLRVADDGVGFPEKLGFRQAESFGLQIVNLLVEQLEGTLELDRTNGTAFTVTFKELNYVPRI